MNDLKGRQNTRCEIKYTITGQNAFNVLTATDGLFFDTANNRNVLLRSQVVDLFTQCAGTLLGHGSEAIPDGTGGAASKPITTMVIVISKDVMKSQNLTSRNASSFNACVGAI